MLRNLNTGTTTTRNERDIRKFPGNANQTADTPNTPADTDKVITRIMKQDECMKAPESTETADSTEQNGSAGREESSDLGISTTRTQGPDIRLSGIGQHGEPLCTPFEDQACMLTAQTHGPTTWAKTIQVIYFEELQVQSVQKLYHHFATRPRHNEHMEQRQEEDANKTSKGRQKEGSRSR